MRVIRAQPLVNHAQNVFGLFEHLSVVESQNMPTVASQSLCAFCISLRCFRLEVLATIELDNEHRLIASEVGEVRGDRMLTAELVAIEAAVAKVSP